MLTDAQFDRTRRLALRLAGVELFDRHRELLDRRSRRLRVQEGAGLDAMLNAAEEGDPTASRQLVGLVTTNFTGFFRHPSHFEVAAEHALWAAHRGGQARLWSAAAATGEEPYSLAMALIEVFRRDDPLASILATDIDEAALAVAQRGLYGEGALRSLEPARRAGFFTETAAGRWGIVPAVRRLVEFRAVNLAGVTWPVEGPFDVIFCRNVLMYLEAGCRQTVLERMAVLLAPDGLLVLDPVEHPGPAGHLFASRKNGIYSLRSISPTSAREGRPPAHRLKTPSL
jgi:chemotaxis protein methyltransferase CheR